MEHNFTIYCSQVSGKQPKLISQDETQLLKGYNQSQDAFYQYLKGLQVDSTAYGFIKWVPTYYGTKQLDKIPIISQNEKVKDEKTKEWLGHLKARYQIRNPQNKFIILENISHHYKKPNVLDIKIGTRNQKTKKHKITKTVSEYLFKLNGCRTTLTQLQSLQKNQNNPPQSQSQQQSQTLFFSKYYCKEVITKEQILQFLAFYFFNGKNIRKSILKNMINQLKQLVLDFSCVTCYRFYSTSICFFCDALDNTKCELKLLDFGRTEFSTWLKPDNESMIGLENILKFLIQILENTQEMQKKLIKNIQNYRKQNILVVPDQKIKQYEENSPRNW